MASFHSSYRNNPFQILQKLVNIPNLVNEETREEEYIRILEIVREILFDNEEWKAATRADVFIKPLLGGITNQLLLIQKLDATSSSQKIVFRLFGGNTVDFINRFMENIAFSNLSKLGCGPIFYGVFINGRIEGFLNGTNLLPNEMTKAPNNLKIAAAVANLHDLQIPELHYLSSLTLAEIDQMDKSKFLSLLEEKKGSYPSNQWLWKKLRLFFELSSNLHFPNQNQQQKYQSLQMDKMFQEFLWFEGRVQSIHYDLISAVTSPSFQSLTSAEQDRIKGRLYALDEVLCHNDLLSGNIMAILPEGMSAGTDTDKTIRLIDFEYAGYNYRGYDISNHFSEYGGFDFDIKNEFPSHENRLAFLKSYLAVNLPENVNNHDFLLGFEEIVLLFTLGSNFFWGTWSVVQAKGASIDFDYISYANLRYEGYFYHKQIFYEEILTKVFGK